MRKRRRCGRLLMPVLYLLAPFALFALVVVTALLVFTQPPSANSPLAARRQAGTTSQVIATTPATSVTRSVVVLTPSLSPTLTPSPTSITPTAAPPATATPGPTAAPTAIEDEEDGKCAHQQETEDRADAGLHLPTTGADPAKESQEQHVPQGSDAEPEMGVTERTRSGEDGNAPDVLPISTADGGGDVVASSDGSTTDLETDAEVAVSSSPVAPEPTAPRPAPTPAPALRIAIVRSPAGFTGTHLRAAPRQGAASLRLLPNGTRVQLLGPLAVADGFRWLQVRTLDGLTGWAVAVAL
jgi:hypothetical protein